MEFVSISQTDSSILLASFANSASGCTRPCADPVSISSQMVRTAGSLTSVI
jgi:hypothetical protein